MGVPSLPTLFEVFVLCFAGQPSGGAALEAKFLIQLRRISQRLQFM
jgi:hypothetical protein